MSHISESKSEAGFENRKPPMFRTGQLFHLICLSVLLCVAGGAWRLAGSPSSELFWVAIGVPVIHQVFVWFVWRRTLLNSTTPSKHAFLAYLIFFFVLFASRFLSLFAIAISDRGSLGFPPALQIGLSIVLFVPGSYAIYSVIRYFGLDRAAGADHFDSAYRTKPLVAKGIFRFTNNGMYLYAFLLFWSVAIAFDSVAATIVAAFSHAYIWIHYFATEKPDMQYLYGTGCKMLKDG